MTGLGLVPRQKARSILLTEKCFQSKLIKSYPPTITEEEALRLRGGRIEWELNSFAGKLWKNLYETANRKLGEDSSLQEQLQSDNLWLSPETKDEGSRIEAWMEYLERRHWYVEAEWKCSFWLIDFFRGLNSNLTRSQLHTFNLENSSLENRCPPIITNTETIVAASKTPYDADPNRQESGFAFSDVSYAVCMDKEVSHQDLVIIKLLPTIRLYDSTHWYMAGVIVEVKPLKIEKECYTDIYWSTTEVYQFSVRYLTLTAMTMLQEYLKLCYMSSPDPTFFPEPDQLIIHLLIAVGHTVWHYIHTIGDGAVGEPIKYVSYCLGTFNMKEARERDQFRDRLNKILVLQVTTFKEAMESKVREVLALGPAEIKRRLESRAHQGVRFSHSVREDGVWGFSVEHSSPTQETKSLLKPDPSPRTIPEDKEAKLEQENRNRENAHLPSSSHPTTRSMTSATIKAQGRKGNKDGGAAALPSHTSTLEEDAQPGGGETSKRRSTTPDVGDARTQGKRGRGIGGGLGRGVGRSGGQAVTASQVTQREEVKGTTRGVGATRGGDVRAPRGGRGRRRGGPPAPT